MAERRDRWGTGETLNLMAPSMAGDAGFARWSARCERASMPPQDASWRYRASFEGDVRHLLGAIRVPTLVVAREGWPGAEQARHVAEHIDGARYVELAGADMLFFAGDTGPLLDAIEEFVTGQLPRHDIDRVLATVMFTDVVGSTDGRRPNGTSVVVALDARNAGSYSSCGALAAYIRRYVRPPCRRYGHFGPLERLSLRAPTASAL